MLGDRLGCTIQNLQRELGTNARAIIRDRRRDGAHASRATCEIERLSIWVGVNEDRRSAASARRTDRVRQQRSPDAAPRKLRRDPKMLKLP